MCGACEKVASDLGLGSGFCQVFRVPPPVTTGNIAEKVTKNRTSEFQLGMLFSFHLQTTIVCL